MHNSYGRRIKETFIFIVMIVVLLFAMYFVSIYLFNAKTTKDDVVTVEPIKKQKTPIKEIVSPKTEPQKKKIVHTTTKDDVVTVEPIKKQKTPIKEIVSPKTEPQKKKIVHTHVRAHVKTKRRITRKKKISWGSQQFIKFHQHEESVFTPSN